MILYKYLPPERIDVLRKPDASGMRRVAAIRILSHPAYAKTLDFLTISITEGDS
jgi:hypothetical protein